MLIGVGKVVDVGVDPGKAANAAKVVVSGIV